MTEEDRLDKHVRALARELRLAAFHFPNSIGVTHRGWPDWVIIGPGGILFRENKSQFGLASPDQTGVLYALRAHGLDVGVWRPSDWEAGRIRAEMETIRVTRPKPAPECWAVLSCCVCRLPAGHKDDHFCFQCCREWSTPSEGPGIVQSPSGS